MNQRRAALCLHGLGVSPRHLAPLVRVLARDRDVDAPTLPLARRVEQLAELVAQRLAARPVLFANSLGCQVAVEVAISHPDDVTGLVLVGPTADPAAPTLRQQFARLALDSMRETAALNCVVATDYLRRGPRRTLQSARLMLEHRMEERLPLVQVPVVVVRGARDPIVPERWAAHAAHLARGRLVTVSGAAHAAHFTHPDAVARAAVGIDP